MNVSDHGFVVKCRFTCIILKLLISEVLLFLNSKKFDADQDYILRVLSPDFVVQC